MSLSITLIKTLYTFLPLLSILPYYLILSNKI